MAPRKNKGHGLIKKRTNTNESKFTSCVPGLEHFHFNYGRHKSAEKFK